MDKKHDIWAVAAAYFLLEDKDPGPFHYTTIAVVAALESVKQICMARHAAARHSDDG
ncbi:MAG TPA: hypothetical protein VJ783_18330 [Pirellulales bacterium]|nr:hypothetical protein [Pirellulales bacterium]